MYLYITEITDDTGDISFFGPFRSDRNATEWGIDDTSGIEGYKFRTIPLLDPHYINDAD